MPGSKPPTGQNKQEWQKFLSTILRKAGFLPTLRDDPLFVAKTPSGGWCFIGTHVDDLFPTFNEEDAFSATVFGQNS